MNEYETHDYNKMKIATTLEEAHPFAERIGKLNKERLNAISLHARLLACGDTKAAFKHQQKLSELNAKINSEKDNIEYVRLSTFIQVAKRYLTAQQFKDVWHQVDEILERPWDFLK